MQLSETSSYPCPMCAQEHAWCDPADPCNERDLFRQAALELHSEIRSALAWKASGAEPAVADHMLLKTADKWRPLLEADASL